MPERTTKAAEIVVVAVAQREQTILQRRQRLWGTHALGDKARRTVGRIAFAGRAHHEQHALFLRALDRYIADALARMDVELGPRHAPVDGLRSFLAGYVDRASGASGRRGCLLVATAMELAGHDPDVEGRIRGFFKAMETNIAGALSRAKLAGELAAGVEPASGARILVCFVEGLRVIGKTGPTRTSSQTTVDALLDRLIR